MVFESKNEARAAARMAVRQMRVGFETETRSMLAAANLTATSFYEEAECLFVFMSKKNEISTTCLIEKAFSDKKAVAIPKTVGNTLEFYLLDPQKKIEEQQKKLARLGMVNKTAYPAQRPDPKTTESIPVGTSSDPFSTDVKIPSNPFA